jgi:hypothetical protein
MVIMTWYSTTSGPRRSRGAASPLYSGTRADNAPTPSPAMNRPTVICAIPLIEAVWMTHPMVCFHIKGRVQFETRWACIFWWGTTYEDDRPEKDGALPSPFQISGETLQRRRGLFSERCCSRYNPDVARAHLSDGSDKSSRSQERGDDGLPVRIQVMCPIGTLFTEPFDEIGHGET